MKILIDESLPRYVQTMLPGHTVRTVQAMGWSGTKNGPLLALAEPQFDVFLTGDKNLRYQQNLQGRQLDKVTGYRLQVTGEPHPEAAHVSKL